MSTQSIVADAPRYVITHEGKEAVKVVELCQCLPRVIFGMLVCERCGTAWGLQRAAFGGAGRDRKR